MLHFLSRIRGAIIKHLAISKKLGYMTQNGVIFSLLKFPFFEVPQVRTVFAINNYKVKGLAA